MKKKSLFEMFDTIKEYEGNEAALIIVTNGEKMGAAANRQEMIPSLLACLFANEKGMQILEDTLILMRDDLVEESLAAITDIVDNVFGEKLGMSVNVNAQNKCSGCRKFSPLACGFGHCSFLDRDIDGEETNAANSQNKHGCKEFRRK